MQMPTTEPIEEIYIDCDILSHFIKGGKLDILPYIYNKKLVINDEVKKEIKKRPGYDTIIDDFIKNHSIEEIKLDDNEESQKEFARLIKSKGRGEAACLALAKVNKKSIASSNGLDVNKYCKANNIECYTTGDFLYEAILSGKMTPADCNSFIQTVKAKNSNLRYDTIEEFAEKKKIKKK